MSDEIELVVGDDEAGRVDKVIARRFPHAGRRQLARMFAAGDVRLDGRRAKKGDRAGPGARVWLRRAPAAAAELRPHPDPSGALEILWSDSDLVAVAKPAGMSSQPLRARELGTAANAIVARYPECALVGDDPREGGLVHRLDRDTSGVLVAARNQRAWQACRRAFAEHRVDKTYLALVGGSIGPGSSTAPLVQRGKRAVVDFGDPAALEAHTRWTVKERVGELTLLECRADTGRMHQVRAHLADAGAAIAGDELYGGPALPGLTGHFLHAAAIDLPHPVGGAPLRLECPLPPDRARLLERLRTHSRVTSGTD